MDDGSGDSHGRPAKRSFSRAVYEGEAEVEGIRAKFAKNFEDGRRIASEGLIPVFADGEAKILKSLRPEVLVDAIMAKKNIGTKIDDAALVIGRGAGVHGRRRLPSGD